VRRDGDIPEAVFEERISGTGSLRRDGQTVPVTRFTLTRRQYDVE
jgi:hypothetical protein